MKKNLLFSALVTLFTVTGFSQTTHIINVMSTPTIDTITVQVGDDIDVVNSASTSQFYVSIDGIGVPGYEPTPTSIGPGAIIFSKNIVPGSVDFDLLVTGIPASQQTIMYHVIVSTSSVSLDEESNFNFSVYPNPTSDFLNITGGDIETVQVFCINGQMMFSNTYSAANVQLDISTLPQGVYCALVNEQQRIKFVKE